MKRYAVILVGMALGAVAACERQPAGSSRTLNRTSSVASTIDFPVEVEADDPAVNAFVRQAIDTCVSGDYERFRLLWSVREEPFPRGEFERGWKAVRKVTIRAVQKMRNPPEGSPYEGKYLYYVHGQVELDESVPDPRREVLLLMVQEGDAWRLARPPQSLRKRVLGDADSPTSRADQSPG